jgi:hypothetical protein
MPLYDETIFGEQSQPSLGSYLLFAKAMDEAVAIISATLPTTLPPLKSWLEIAHEEVAKSLSLPLACRTTIRK